MLILALVVASSLLSPAAGRPARDLTFEERVDAQRAIERVSYAHLIGATTPFERAVPRAILEKKVRDALEQSVLLEERFATRITAEMLHRELERMARQTRAPERLTEMFAALDNDAFLIHECIARPALVSRLARSFFAADATIHGKARREVEEIRGALADGALNPLVDHPRRTIVTIVRGDDEKPGVLSPEANDSWTARLPEGTGRASPVLEQDDRFSVDVVLDRRPGRMRVATFTARKESWDSWWERVRTGFDAARLAPLTSDDPLLSVLPAPTGPGCAQDTWDVATEGRSPAPRFSETAVWTGSLVLVWGGFDFSLGRVNTGGRYDPATDTWEPTSLVGAPAPREAHVAVWTGTSMLVWGGANPTPLDTGGAYDPVTDTWYPMTPSGVSASGAAGVWTGEVMLVWGGGNDYGLLAGGKAYDPTSDEWSALSITGAPSARSGHTAVWTGTEMLIWGGSGSGQPPNTGGRYDPDGDTWTPMATAGAPAGRTRHTAVWSGNSMIVWGGRTCVGGTCSRSNTGGRYSPFTNSWAPVSLIDAPSPRESHTAAWADLKMIVWGGSIDNISVTNSGGSYDPVFDLWTPLPTLGAPAPRTQHAAVWTGSRMIVWGGRSGLAPTSFDTGGRYDPESNAWTPMSTSQVPYPRVAHSAIWTGTEMIVWGGEAAQQFYLDTGGRYDPATSTWRPTSLAGAPSARDGHTAVWTGNRMVVWGGGGSATATGGVYDPLADTWIPTSLTNAASPRRGHTSVWTGTTMVVWGGRDASAALLGTGGRYDPVTDTWASVATAGAPSPRDGHVAVWTGDRMAIWGGTGPTATGGLYDPAHDTWTTTSMTGAPSPRAFASAVWTGHEMIVWGGLYFDSFGDGARYDPSSDHWTTMSNAGAPSPRYRDAAIWTGREMIVWGGDSYSFPTGTGGRYDPLQNSWTPTSSSDAPSARSGHSAIWTGDRMFVWGGAGTTGFADTTEHAYCGCIERAFYRDLDGDGRGDGAVTIKACNAPTGYVDRAGDCNDASAAIWAKPGEVTDLRLLDRTTLSWNPPDYPGASSVSYQALRAQDPSDFVSSAICLAPSGATRVVVDAQVPPNGLAFFYLVRALNGCPSGQGTLGEDSSGVERIGRACP